MFIYTCYVAFLVAYVFLTHFIIGNIILLCPFKDKQGLLSALTKPLIKSFFILAIIRVNVKFYADFPKDYNCVVVANHQSLLDIFVLMAYVPKRLIFFAKQELSKVPILNWGLVNMGHVFVDRAQATKALQQLEKMEEKLKNNLNVFVFPEGTRTLTGKMTPFKRGAFHLAAKMKKPVVPCYINGTFNILKKDKMRVVPGNITLVVGKVINDSFEDNNKKVSIRLQYKANQIVSEFEKEYGH